MRRVQDVDVLERVTTTSPSRPLRLTIPIALAVVVADQWTKRWALGALEPGSCSQPDACIDLFAGIQFHLVFNTGAAFTRGSGYGPVFGVLAFFMSGFLFYLASHREDRLGAALFGTVAGGAIGNLIDRIFRADDGLLSGAVVDFIDVGWWPVFNIADAAIVCGVIAIIIMSFFEEPPEAEKGGDVGDAGDGIEVDNTEVADDADDTDEANETEGDIDGEPSGSESEASAQGSESADADDATVDAADTDERAG